MAVLGWTLVLPFVPVGCARSGVLVAETGHHRLTARDPATGITIVLTTGVWEGRPADLEDDLTVVHAMVANMGERKVLLAPGDLELRDLRGFRYDLLDVGATFHLASETRTPSGAYGRAYRQGYDIGRTDDFQVIRTAGDLSRNGLPWGVLEPGTQMRGYLYFEAVHRTGNGAALTWHLGTPEHHPLVDMRFDFLIARKPPS